MDVNMFPREQVNGRRPTRRPRLVVFDRFAVVAEGLAHHLREDFVVVPVVVREDATVAGLLLAAQVNQADLALVSSELGPVVNVERLITDLVAGGKRVVAVDSTPGAGRVGMWARCLARGGTGIVSGNESVDALRRALLEAASGRPSISFGIATRLVSAVDTPVDDRRAQADERLRCLTPRERQVLGMLMSGLSRQSIARRSLVTDATVQGHIRSIMRKLGVRSQLAAVAIAHRAGWLPAPDLAAG